MSLYIKWKVDTNRYTIGYFYKLSNLLEKNMKRKIVVELLIKSHTYYKSTVF